MTPQLVAPKVLSWATDLEANTIEQAARSASLPFLAGHLALMPDAHLGYGATIGSVIPTRGAVIPSAVGVDIGCGMIAAELPFLADALPDDLSKLHGYIAKAVPSGLGKSHNRRGPLNTVALRLAGSAPSLTEKQKATYESQLGTLGSGNHFIEVCVDERNRVWVVLHSGSRGIGKQLADVHIAAAKGLMARYFIELPDPDLAYLVEGTAEFDAYIRAMLWAQDYAALNRQTMMDNVFIQIAAVVGREFEPSRVVNCHHNFCIKEHHGGSDVWVTRKGAIRARTGDLGVIPGSMGTDTFIVSGLGNPASYDSCSHGAGRRMSRGQARRELDVETLNETMGDRAWNHDAKALIDEDPRAYKDIDVVMANQADLVAVEHRLHQILNYKGA